MTISIPPNPVTFLDGDFFTATELNHIQGELNKCIDGYNGGTYVLTHSLVVGGMSLNANSGVGALDANFAGLVSAANGLETTGFLSVLGAVTLATDTSVGGNLTVTGTVQSVSSSTSNFGGTIVAPSFNSAFDSFVGGALHVTNGVLPRLVVGAATSGTHLYSPNSYDIVIAPSTLSMDETYQIDDTGLGSTNRIMEFVNFTGNLVHILNPVGVELAQSPIKLLTGTPYSIRYWRTTGGDWEILDYKVTR